MAWAVPHTYCHGFAGSHVVTIGENVELGQALMHSASTGDSTGPHPHFAIQVGGQARCLRPFPVAISEGVAIAPLELPASGCSL